MNRVPFKHKQGHQGRILQGHQIDGGGCGHHSSTLFQGAKINDSLGPPVCDFLDTPLLPIQILKKDEFM